MLTSVVDAMEDRDVATVDTPNVFAQPDLPTDNPEEKQVTRKMRGKLALLAVQTNHNCVKSAQQWKNATCFVCGIVEGIAWIA